MDMSSTHGAQECKCSLKSRCDTKVLTGMTRGVARPRPLCPVLTLPRLQTRTCMHTHTCTHTRGNAAPGRRFKETRCFPAGCGHRCLPVHVYSTTGRRWCLSVCVSVCHCQSVCVTKLCHTHSHRSTTAFVCSYFGALACIEHSVYIPLPP